jgi:hypothetical protein
MTQDCSKRQIDFLGLQTQTRVQPMLLTMGALYQLCGGGWGGNRTQNETKKKPCIDFGFSPLFFLFFF